MQLGNMLQVVLLTWFAWPLVSTEKFITVQLPVPDEIIITMNLQNQREVR